MMIIQVRCIGADVAEWSNENGAGESLVGKGGFEVGRYDSVDKAIEATKDITGYSGKIEADQYDENGYLTISVIEDGDGCQDDNGRYIVDYIFIFERVEQFNPVETKGVQS